MYSYPQQHSQLGHEDMIRKYRGSVEDDGSAEDLKAEISPVYSYPQQHSQLDHEEIKQRLKRDTIGRSVLFHHSHDLNLKELDDPERPDDDELTGPESNPDTMMLAKKRHIRAIQWKLLYAVFGVFIAGPVVAYFLAMVVCQIKQRLRLPLRNKQHNEDPPIVPLEAPVTILDIPDYI